MTNFIGAHQPGEALALEATTGRLPWLPRHAWQREDRQIRNRRSACAGRGWVVNGGNRHVNLLVNGYRIAIESLITSNNRGDNNPI